MEKIFSTPLYQRIVAALPPGLEIYLVGGAVRDGLLGRDCYDLDFILPKDALRTARELADKIGGAYFPLDADREYARIALAPGEVKEAGRVKLDFATFQGGTLDNDLRLRDFTINAMAINVHQPQILIDPVGGAQDLLAKKLRVCSPDSLKNDPLRIMRAVRQAVNLDLRIMPETIRLMRQTANQLAQVSPERQRDELFRILDGSNPRAGLEILDRVGALNILLPEVVALKGLEQSPPHQYDAWMHTLEAVKRLSMILTTLAEDYDADNSANLLLGLVSLRLGRYRQALGKHLSERLNPDRSLRALLFLSILFHDIGKLTSKSLDEAGRVRFHGHEWVSEQMATKRALALHLSNPEIDRLKLVVGHHMRPFFLGQLEGLPTRRAIYRFFRDTGPAGVDICILSLADTLATYGATLKQDDWAHHLDVVRTLLEAWWENPTGVISPPIILNGDELMMVFNLLPGPKVGQLLEAIREAQAMGLVSTKEQAVQLAGQLLEK